jgi:hypothetical protein
MQIKAGSRKFRAAALLVMLAMMLIPAGVASGSVIGRCEAAFYLCIWERGYALPLGGDLYCLAGYAFCKAYIKN